LKTAGESSGEPGKLPQRSNMHAMVLNKVGGPLVWTELPDRLPGPGQIRVKVAACGVCRTDLHVVDGEFWTQPSSLPPLANSCCWR
jgi:D-arabinose 1-dehydrogenase-like Zn-dependent alcohol dehydrogenase